MSKRVLTAWIEAELKILLDGVSMIETIERWKIVEKALSMYFEDYLKDEEKSAKLAIYRDLKLSCLKKQP